MRRIATIRTTLLAAALVAPLGLAACGDDDDVAADAPVAEAPATTAATAPATPDTTAPAVPTTVEGPFEAVAVDYAYEGLPEQVSVGTHQVTLHNEGAEQHEVAVFQLKDGATMEQLMGAQSQQDAMQFIDLAGVIYASPGEAATGELNFAKPGEYMVVCMIPTADGTPHIAHGMQSTITAV